MNEDIRVHVVNYGRPSLYMRYRDPLTGKQIARTTGTKRKKDAERIAAKWEAELQEGRYKSPLKVTWDEFRDRYEREKLSGLSDGYFASMSSAMNRLEAMGVQRLSQVTPDLLSRFQAMLREGGVSESTIRTYLKHLRAAFSWAVEVGMLNEVPKATMPKRARKSAKMKGRPITVEEFERMLAVTASVRPQDAALWRRYLWGVWLSGLRRAESLRLTWDDDGDFCVDLMGKYPRFLILAEGQKRHQDELLPMTPDFAEWLLQTPESERTGKVFPLPVHDDAAGRIVGDIGRKAGVVVDKKADKFATCHDLRRSFGTRWSKRVRTATLQKLMRHADIKTTMAYYVDQDADDIAADLWTDHKSGNTSGNSVVGATGFEPATF